jgi:threonine aldolase
MLGGGVRQGGVLAAACLVALDRIPELAESHENAQRLAEGLGEYGWATNAPDTNIVLAEVPDIPTALAWLDSLGIRAVPMAGRVRFVTHRDLSAADVEEALRRIKTGA